MKYFCCIDDTDNIDSVGTGTIAEEIKGLYEGAGWGKGSVISRHQLYIHPDIPYTSHNSSMCFEFIGVENIYERMIQCASDYLKKRSAAGSDPGLCILSFKSNKKYQRLIDFSLKAKKEVLTKIEANEIAKSLGIHLSEHGGTGQGIIGALAGVGLRMTGNDGEVKGALKDKIGDGVYSVRQLLEFPEVEAVIDFNSDEYLSLEQNVLLNGRSKSVFHNHQPVLFVYKNKEGLYEAYTKNHLRRLGEVCPVFKADVKEEWVFQEVASCYNCRYRRWTEENFTCLKGIKK